MRGALVLRQISPHVPQSISFLALTRFDGGQHAVLSVYNTLKNVSRLTTQGSYVLPIVGVYWVVQQFESKRCSYMKIKAVIASEKDKVFSYEDVEIDAPREDEIRVKIMAVGLCHTDVIAREGLYQLGRDAVLGHEGAGIVEKVGKNITKVKPGDRVAISFRSCGTCRRCGQDNSAYCTDFIGLNISGKRQDGSSSLRQEGKELASNFFGQSSFASHAITYETNVVILPDDVPFEIAAPLGCGIQTGAGTVLRSLTCEAGSSIIVTGCGTVGLSAVMAAKIAGCDQIIAIEPVASRRQLAVSLGATHTIDPTEHEDFEAAIRDIILAGVDYAVDTTGRRLTLENLTRCFTTNGVLALVGMPTSLDDDFQITGVQFLASGLTVKGIIEGNSHPDIFIPQLMDYYRNGQLPVDDLIKTYPLSDIDKAVHDHHAGNCVKAVLIP